MKNFIDTLSATTQREDVKLLSGCAGNPTSFIQSATERHSPLVTSSLLPATASFSCSIFILHDMIFHF